MLQEGKASLAVCHKLISLPMAFNFHVQERFCQKLYEFPPWNMFREIW